MLIRISLILAIIAALAAGTLNILQVRDKITTLISQRNDERSQKEQAQTELASTKKTLAKTQADLTQTQSELADTKTQRDQAIATATAQTKRADDLSTKLAQTTQERDDAQNQLASYKNTGLTPEQVLTLNKSLKNAQVQIEAENEEKLVLLHTIGRLTNELNKYIGPNQYVTLRADLKGKIVVVDPKWDFVVLDIGEDQGLLQDGELLVSRDGKLIAKVIVRSIQKDRSIANLVPGWKLGEVIEGDEVTPAHPAT
jgi:multidrug efflux pump subunit AcrA (membrane-fusion protein)